VNQLATVLVPLGYLATSALFILGLRDLAHPGTAIRGNALGAVAMAVAVAAALIERRILGSGRIAMGLVVGGALGALLAETIQMTAMPHMVALLNGFGGAASVLVAWTAASKPASRGRFRPEAFWCNGRIGFVGSVTFWGILVGFGKLQGLISEKQIRFRGQQAVNALLAAVALGLGGWSVAAPSIGALYPAIVAASSALGVLLVLPIAGAHIPVVIALLNSYSGLSAAATGFVLDNDRLVIPGSLVGASGVVLTRIMCRAMNRLRASIAFGVIGPGGRPQLRGRCVRRAGEGHLRRRTGHVARSSAARRDRSRLRCLERSTRRAIWPTSWRSAVRRWSSESTRWQDASRAT